MEFRVVTGPPCSGKSTWIAEHSGGADVFARTGLDNDPAQVTRDRGAFVARHSGKAGACYIEACRAPAFEVGEGDTITYVPMRADERACLGRLEASKRTQKARWREVIRSYFSEPSPETGSFHVEASPHGDEGPHGPESEEPMPEETSTEAIEATNEAQGEVDEPQGEGTDLEKAIANSRKWEKRAKSSNKENERLKGELEALQKTLEGYKTDAEKQSETEKTAAQTIEELKAQLAEAHAKAERESLVRKVAKSKGVDAELLLRMLGNDEETITSNADLILQTTKPSWQSAPDEGASAKAPRMSKDEILAVKNPKERLRMIAQNQDLFRE